MHGSDGSPLIDMMPQATISIRMASPMAGDDLYQKALAVGDREHDG